MQDPEFMEEVMALVRLKMRLKEDMAETLGSIQLASVLRKLTGGIT